MIHGAECQAKDAGYAAAKQHDLGRAAIVVADVRYAH